jgi:hypothetical protein
VSHALHIGSRHAERLHPLVEEIRRMRPSRHEAFQIASGHAEFAGDPLDLTAVEAPELIVAMPPLAQARKEMVGSFHQGCS